MNAVDKKMNTLSAKRIALQKAFNDYNEKNGFSYEDWINPPAGHFYEGYKRDMDAINHEMAPPMTYS